MGRNWLYVRPLPCYPSTFFNVFIALTGMLFLASFDIMTKPQNRHVLEPDYIKPIRQVVHFYHKVWPTFKELSEYLQHHV